MEWTLSIGHAASLYKELTKNWDYFEVKESAVQSLLLQTDTC